MSRIAGPSAAGNNGPADPAQGAPVIAGLFPSLSPSRRLEGMGRAAEDATPTPRSGMRLDAPWRCRPTRAMRA